MTENKTAGPGTIRIVLMAGIIIAAFVGSYSLATAGSRGAGSASRSGAGPVSADTAGGVQQAALGVKGTDAGGPACACCGGAAAPATPIEGSASLEGGMQRISVDLSSGYYNPNTIKLKAGIPTEITFGQGSGCTGQVLSKDLGFFEDLTSGPKTVQLPALQPGTYGFSCGMEMVFGTIVVE